MVRYLQIRADSPISGLGDTFLPMIDGFCSPKFDAVKAAFEANFTQGHDVGASVAVVHRGEVVIDLWGGHTDASKSTEWSRDTIVNVWSTTKTMTALCMLILIDRGQLDPDAPVAKYWPEFEANGKGNVLVRHIMSHTAGLPGWDEPIDASVLFDWDRTCALLAAQPSWWEPGTASGYHAISQGYLCGEVVRRVSGLSLGEFFAREVAGQSEPTSISERARPTITGSSRLYLPFPAHSTPRSRMKP